MPVPNSQKMQMKTLLSYYIEITLTVSIYVNKIEHDKYNMLVIKLIT